jgi:predicted DNA-binding transcriptional regulator AlpA
MEPTGQPVLLIQDIAELFGVSSSQAYVYVAQPGFPPPLFGHRRNRKWPTSSVLDYINDVERIRSTPLPPIPSRSAGRMDFRNASIEIRTGRPVRDASA